MHLTDDEVEMAAILIHKNGKSPFSIRLAAKLALELFNRQPRKYADNLARGAIHPIGE